MRIPACPSLMTGCLHSSTPANLTMKFKSTIEATTFDELVAYGLAHDDNIVNGIP